MGGFARVRERGCLFGFVALVTLAACSGAEGPPGDAADAAAVAPATPGTATTAPDSYAGTFSEVTEGFRAQSVELQQRAEAAAGDPEAIVSVYERLLATAQQARSGYGELAAPDPVQAQHVRILQLLDRQVSLLEDLLAAIEADDNDGIGQAAEGLVALTEDFAAARQAMQRALATCGAPCTT